MAQAGRPGQMSAATRQMNSRNYTVVMTTIKIVLGTIIIIRLFQNGCHRSRLLCGQYEFSRPAARNSLL